MNNFISLGVIEKYLSFLCVTRVLPPSSGFITGMHTCLTLGQLSIFKVVQYAEVWTHVNFLVLLRCRGCTN